MRITVIGCGYVGLVTGACLAEAGHEVICTDNDSERIATLKAGVIPIYEPYLDALLVSNVKANGLSFTCDSASASNPAMPSSSALAHRQSKMAKLISPPLTMSPA